MGEARDRLHGGAGCGERHERSEASVSGDALDDSADPDGQSRLCRRRARGMRGWCVRPAVAAPAFAVALDLAVGAAMDAHAA